jgi:hypothetical protein
MEDEKKIISGLTDIDLNTPEGRLLMAALAVITIQLRPASSPEEIIRDLYSLDGHMFAHAMTVIQQEKRNIN